MLLFVLKRFAALVPMLLGVSLLIFFFLRMSGTDPAFEYLRLSQIPPTDQALAQARAELGLDQPVVVQYLRWLQGAVVLDFGKSFMTGRPVLGDFLYYLPATLQLATAAFLFTMLVSIPLGVWSARHQNRWPDFVVRGIAFLGVSMPNFWTGFLLVLLFSVGLGVLPAMGMGTPAHFLMPVLAVSFMSLSINARLLRGSMLETNKQRHVLYAALRGLSPARIERRHVLRNALLPIVTSSGMHIGELLGGSLIVESIFGWPGVGRYAISAIGNNDYPVVQCFVVLMTIIFVVCNLVIDIVYASLDPRIRLNAEATR